MFSFLGHWLPLRYSPQEFRTQDAYREPFFADPSFAVNGRVLTVAEVEEKGAG